MRLDRELIFIRNADTGKRRYTGTIIPAAKKNVIDENARVKDDDEKSTTCIAHFFFPWNCGISNVKSTRRTVADNFTRGSHDSRSTTTAYETVSILVTVRGARYSSDSNGKVISLGNIRVGSETVPAIIEIRVASSFARRRHRSVRFGTSFFLHDRDFCTSMEIFLPRVGPLNPLLAAARRINGARAKS